MELANDRAYALAIARRVFYERNVELDFVVETFADTEDPLIVRVVELMVHEPARTGFLTVSQRDYERNYWPEVAAALVELEKGDAGVLPPEPRIGAKRLIWTSIGVLFVAAVSAENLRDFARHISGREPMHVILAALKLGFGLLFAFMSVAGGFGVVRGIRIAVAQRRDERSGA